MSSSRLSPTSYVVLGMVALRGPTTSYDLKRAVGRSVGYFWRFPHTQLYDEPARLAENGLLRVAQENDGRRRRTYTVTEAGLAALREWLREPTAEHFQLRDIAELKLFFSELVEPERVSALAAEQVRIHRERLAEYERIQQRFGDHPELANRMAPLALGLELERAALSFWTHMVAWSPSGAEFGSAPAGVEPPRPHRRDSGSRSPRSRAASAARS